MPTYRLAVPAEWNRISLASGARASLAELVDEALSRLPADVPPDQVGPLRTSILARIDRMLGQASSAGAVELYLPTRPAHGVTIASSFVIADIAPEFRPVAEITADNYAALTMAELLTGTDARRVATHNAVWVRRERVQPPNELEGIAAPSVAVDYLAPMPGVPGSWIGVMFSTLGDGNPTSDFTRLMVELFDAIMSTWSWVDDDIQASPPEEPGIHQKHDES